MVIAPDYRKRIVLDPDVRFGKPVVRGTRITVGDVLGYLAVPWALPIYADCV